MSRRRNDWAGSGVAVLLLGVLALTGCGEDTADLPSPVGVYVLDRVDYARALLEDGTKRSGRDPGSADEEGKGPPSRAEIVEAARREAARLEIRLALEDDGSFIVRYRFGKEQGRNRGAWRQEGDRVTLTTTDAPSGPLGTPEAAVARYGPAGLRFERGVVPRPFLLRRE